MRFEGEARWGLDTYFSTIMKGIEHLHAWIVRRKTRGKTMNEGKEKVPRQTLGTRAYPEPGIVVQEGSTAVQ